MKLKLNRLVIRIHTNDGLYGTDINFTPGLFILRAENTTGKSTCINAIVYALGLEGMFGPSQHLPFTEVMHNRLISESGKQVNVVSSYVFLEIENKKGEVCTLRRDVAGIETQKRKTIRVYNGSYSSKDDSEKHDYFVRVKRAAQSELGFHVFLAKFIGFDLPYICSQDGLDVPLYLECIMPYFLVDQQNGWHDVKSRMPTYLPIPDMAKRTAEYILNLDSLVNELKKQELLRRKTCLEGEWQNTIRENEKKMPDIGYVIRGVPELPKDKWDVSKTRVLLSVQDKWLLAQEEIVNLNNRKIELEKAAIPKAKEVPSYAIDMIAKLEEKLEELQIRYEKTYFNIFSDKEQIGKIDVRLGYLHEDLQKYDDEKRLIKRGGELSESIYSNCQCPTCGSYIKEDILLTQDSDILPMTLDESIDFIREQILTFAQTKKDIQRVIEGNEAKVVELKREMLEVAEQIQAQKDILRSEGELPSIAAISERLQITNRLERVYKLNDAFQNFKIALSGLYEEWVTVKSELETLKELGLSILDEKKLDRLNELYKKQIEIYGFKSYQLKEISISKYTYRPCVEQKDLGGTSASDAIRSIWAYMLSVLELSTEYNINHFGFLVFDEPRQQMVSGLSYEHLLGEAVEVAKNNRQIIFATSEKLEELHSELHEDDVVTICSFKGRIIKKLS